QGCAPRALPPQRPIPAVSGLETVRIDRSRNFTNIGERTNVAGSRKFARLISEGKYQEALQVASDQVDGGAVVIDINMDDAMLDSEVQMRTFLRYIASEPSVGRAAIMIDSSHFNTIETALKNVQGRSIVNSISLKDGQEEFLRRARFINQMGAAMVVMAFDEQGQAETFDRKTEICKRSYDLLTSAGIPAQDIIFDPNILSIGTGIESHARFGVDYIEAVRWIKGNLPGALTSGGVSNLSFAFRGKNTIREAMHSAFLYHAIEAGLDMAIVNPQMLQVYSQIDPQLLKAVEDLIFDRDPGATERLIAYAQSLEQTPDTAAQSAQPQDNLSPEERICRALVKGGSPTLEADLLKALETVGDPVKLIEGPLMKGMEQVGDLFATGKMFLPQVVRSAKVMQDAVTILQPYMLQSAEAEDRPVIVIATVKGDVHDIGKNITSIVLQCSGFKVIDLGVMVPAEDILAKAKEVSASIIAVSGLITPSLFRMEELCRKMTEEGFTQPLFVGGAAASAVHTAVKLAPLYHNVHYGADASASAVMAKKYIADPEAFIRKDDEEHARLRAMRASAPAVQDASIGSTLDCYPAALPPEIPLQEQPSSDYIPDFDWKTFNAVCRVP
ncbi:MAG: dihydropteroate synthase, partial [Bacteroidales bacterium]|nr:dihydropteroate synthase [Bacteroidales bacterium]